MFRGYVMEKVKSKEVVKVEPAKLLSPLDDMERRFEDFFGRPLSVYGPSWFPRLRMPEMAELSPTVDIFDDGGDVVIKAELRL